MNTKEQKYINQDLVDRRINGELPRIKIGDQSFIIDWRLKELRPEDHPGLNINLKYLPLTPTGDGYYFFLHTPTLQVVPISNDITSFPKDVVLVEIPNELSLDPIGVAREYGMEDTEMLKTFPIQRNLVAKVTELEDTPLAGMVLRNREKNKLSQALRKLKPKSKGKGYRR